MDSSTPAELYTRLVEHLRRLDGLLVAYSGGVDSTLLAVAAREALGDRSVAVLASSETYPESEVVAARKLAAELGLELLQVHTHEIDDPDFAQNTPDRCYHCKTELFGMLAGVAKKRGLAHVADGANADDTADHRPGSRAAAERGVLSPLRDLGITKEQIRAMARMRDLPNWDKPSMACLASRFPYGEAVTTDGVLRVGRAETALREMGLRQFRVRSHGTVARIEVAPDELEDAWRFRDRIADAVKNAGFAYASLDLTGYRTGSLNEVLPQQ